MADKFAAHPDGIGIGCYVDKDGNLKCNDVNPHGFGSQCTRDAGHEGKHLAEDVRSVERSRVEW